MSTFNEATTKSKTKGWNFNEKSRNEENKYAVIFHNDDTTPMEYVCLVLMMFFEKTVEKSLEFMLYVHKKGSGVAGVYDIDTAYEKVKYVEDFNKDNGMNLMLTVDKV